mmetsp:Transcript_10270/g.19718  ORF Transcript_10270/g.19718 Transcript_10270/m.19718 type:complete len:205 (-) Transcript_10270:53-667(-)
MSLAMCRALFERNHTLAAIASASGFPMRRCFPWIPNTARKTLSLLILRCTPSLELPQCSRPRNSCGKSTHGKNVRIFLTAATTLDASSLMPSSSRWSYQVADSTSLSSIERPGMTTTRVIGANRTCFFLFDVLIFLRVEIRLVFLLDFASTGFSTVRKQDFFGRTSLHSQLTNRFGLFSGVARHILEYSVAFPLSILLSTCWYC